MCSQRSVLIFSYKDEYGDTKEYKTVDIEGLTESEINAVKARTYGEMYDFLVRQYGSLEPIQDSGPTYEQLEEDVQRLLMKIEILKEMLGEAYGNKG
jgi:hypothetical protein